jgi:hypothetical protein
MATPVNRLSATGLPNRFPQGTRFVIEGRAGRVKLQYLELPDGRHIVLPAEPANRLGLSHAREAVYRAKIRRKKNLILSGTVARLQR